MRECYAARLQVLLEEGRARLAGMLDFSPVEAGLQTVGWLQGDVTGEAVEKAAAARGVEVAALSGFSRRALGREGLQLGFAAVDEVEIARGVRELAIAIDGVRRARRSRR